MKHENKLWADDLSDSKTQWRPTRMLIGVLGPRVVMLASGTKSKASFLVCRLVETSTVARLMTSGNYGQIQVRQIAVNVFVILS